MAKLLAQDPGYINTCATRLSVALLGAGVAFRGRLAIKRGTYTGKHIEPGAKLLADELAQKAVFGRPEILAPSAASSRDITESCGSEA